MRTAQKNGKDTSLKKRGRPRGTGIIMTPDAVVTLQNLVDMFPHLTLNMYAERLETASFTRPLTTTLSRVLSTFENHKQEVGSHS